MARIYRTLGSFFLSAALVAPVAAKAGVRLPDDRRQDDRRRDDDNRDKHKRYYDRDRRDYHDWDDREERAYRHWLEERREEYRAYDRLERARQIEYWRWRHDHADWDGRLRVYDYGRRDWHDWDDRDERAYRYWLAERRRTYVGFSLQTRSIQIDFWTWRHDHPDWDGPRRVYDWDARVWHDWDDREERAYRHWCEERRVTYVQFDILIRPRQIEYWKWRRAHPDRDDRDRDRR